MAIKLFLALSVIAAQVMAQAPTQTAEVEVAIEVPDSALPSWLSSFFQMGVPPCHKAAQKNACTGSPREIAMCLAGSPDKLSDACTTELFQEALSQGDAQLLEMLAPKVQTMLSSTQGDTEPLVVADEHNHHMHHKGKHHKHHNGEHHKHHDGEHHEGNHHEHHKSDPHVHPIVENLRQACATEFTSGTCSFALSHKKVCPRMLLRCLVQHRNQLGEQCTHQAREEIVRVTQHDRSPMHIAVSFLAWVLIFLALFACCRCCVRCIRMCCCRAARGDYEVVEANPVVVEVQPSAPLMSEEDEIKIALKRSLADCKGERIVDGVPVAAHDQV